LKNIQNTVKYKSIELFLLFFALPVFLATSFSKYVKFTFVVMGIIYVGYLLIRAKQWKIQEIVAVTRKNLLLRMAVFSILILILGIIIIQFYDPTLLFKVPRTNPLLWVIILFVYSFLSVIPQELVYRKFFYMRYADLFKSKKLFFCINVLCFSLCHLLA